LVLFLQPADLGGHRCRARFDASMVGFDKRRSAARLQFRIIQEQDYIFVQRALICFQRQRIVALLLYDLLGDGALAVQRIGCHDGALER
jgi:hypothetical protein